MTTGISPRVQRSLPQASHKAAGALGVGAAILYVFLWASAFVPSRILAHSAPPLTILWIRFLIAGSALFLGARLAGLPLPRDAATWLRLLLLGTLGNALYLGLNYEALRHLSAGKGSIVASTNPLILALLAPWLLREPLTKRKATGLLLGFGGVVLAMHTPRLHAGGAAHRRAHLCRGLLLLRLLQHPLQAHAPAAASGGVERRAAPARGSGALSRGVAGRGAAAGALDRAGGG